MGDCVQFSRWSVAEVWETWAGCMDKDRVSAVLSCLLPQPVLMLKKMKLALPIPTTTLLANVLTLLEWVKSRNRNRYVSVVLPKVLKCGCSAVAVAARRNGVFFAINLPLVKIQCGTKLKSPFATYKINKNAIQAAAYSFIWTTHVALISCRRAVCSAAMPNLPLSEFSSGIVGGITPIVEAVSEMSWMKGSQAAKWGTSLLR